MRVVVVGGSGFTGSELLRLIDIHPVFELEGVTSRRMEGESVDSTFPNLSIDPELEFLDPEDVPDADIYFTAVPHKAAMKYVPSLLDKGKVVDLSADYRLPVDMYEDVYGVTHEAPIHEAVYGLPEVHREKLKETSLVANPGCYPTGAILAAYPLVKENLVEKVVFDSKSGISGAGANPSRAKMYTSVAENVYPYKITRHRHLAEIKNELNMEDTHFTPHVVSMSRGIETTAHLFLKKDLKKDIEGQGLENIYKDFYRNETFIKTLKKGSLPETRNLTGSNFVHIGGFQFSNGRAVICSAIDNLVKGASGAAIQNANLITGLPEETGLKQGGLGI